MKKIVSVFVVLMCCLTIVQAQTMQLELRKWDNTETKIQLSDIRNLIFNGSDMQINLKNGSQSVMPKADVKKMVFSVNTNTSELSDIKSEIKIYPNPANASFQFSSLPAQTNLLSVYSISGQVLIQKIITSIDEKIDISEIPSGIYLVKLNDQVLKLTKK